MLNLFNFKFYLVFILYLLSHHLNAYDKVQAEKVSFPLHKSSLHPSLHTTENKNIDINVIIPTDMVSEKSWQLRAWELSFPLSITNQYLALGISYQINTIIVNLTQFFAATDADRKEFLQICHDYDIQIIIKTDTITLPVSNDMIKNLDLAMKMNQIKGAYFNFSGPDINLNQEQTTQLMDILFQKIPQNKLLLSDTFSRKPYFLNSLKQCPLKPSICLNWSEQEALPAPLNPWLEEISSNIIKINMSFNEFGGNKSIVMLQDYIGYRMTQCLLTKNKPQGFILEFNNQTTPFSTLNEINVFAISELLINPEKDLDRINYNWFSTQFGSKSFNEILEISTLCGPLLRKIYYYKNNGNHLATKNSFPLKPSQLLISSPIKNWLNIDLQKSPKTTDLNREKIEAKEIFQKFNSSLATYFKKNTHLFNNSCQSQLFELEQKLELYHAYTYTLIYAQFYQLQTEQKTFKDLKMLCEKFKRNDLIDDFIQTYINFDSNIWDAVADENKPNYRFSKK